MNTATVIAVIALVCVVFLAARYIYKEKKKGTRCIGCPLAGQCPRHACGAQGAAQSRGIPGDPGFGR